MGEKLRPMFEREAKERQKAAGKERGRGKIAVGKLPEAIGRVNEQIGQAVGLGRKTYEKVAAVI